MKGFSVLCKDNFTSAKLALFKLLLSFCSVNEDDFQWVEDVLSRNILTVTKTTHYAVFWGKVQP